MEYRKHFYTTLFSNASQETYPENTLSEFRIQLAQRIFLGSTDSWVVGLCEFSCPPPVSGRIKPVEIISSTNALVYCDLIRTVGSGCGQYGRCLRTFIHESKYCDHSFEHVYYMPVEKCTFQDISIAIADLYGKKIPFKTGVFPTKVVLHFRRV
jgi:hypothetical protein